ncbi:hypothetical protein [Pelosinus sp. UFO1]|jgi:hypothetical protein|uniref:hypothetical protein n=1 Tax=Pelosinus sp. UFO1 TaxID=484770 RepID=UPI0004D15466|nr:hypothetical protein [Pelosinus sp. UFO1]AIF50096.1 hypothetical protein UFO1_0539 [Pelosinus sp. UFO1]
MRKSICILFAMVMLIWPNVVLAAEYMLNINVIKQEDGTTCTELWYDNKMVWRIAVLADGAKPVSGFYNTKTTYIAPDIRDGLFMIKVQ